MSQTRQRQSLVSNLTLTVITLVGCLLVAELGLRIVGYSAPVFRTVDTELGWTLSPNVQGWNHKENKNFIAVNSSGQNDREYSMSKPEGTIRIAVLGDSFTQAIEVDREKNFISLLEGTLNEQVGKDKTRIEVLNFGVVGYGTTQQLLLLRKTVWRYDPDIVLLAFFIGNDVSDNHRSLAESLQRNRPYFHYDGEKLIQDPSFPDHEVLTRDKIMLGLINNSRLLQLLKEFMLRRHTGWRLKGDKAPEREPSANDTVYLPPSTREWKEAWKVTEELVLTLNSEVRSRGRKFLFVTVPEALRVHPDSTYRKNFAKKLSAENLDYPDHRLKALADEHAIAIRPLAPALTEVAERRNVFLHGFNTSNLGTGHWNILGHQVVAELLAAELEPVIGN